MAGAGKNRTFVGVAWSAVERFAVQGINFLLQLVIARLLLPSDYGLIAMLVIFLAIAQCFIDSGFGNALIQKQDRTQTDYSTVFYFNIAVGVAMYLLMVLASPFIARFYEQPILQQIILWWGLNLIINSFAIVQRTILTVAINFKLQAIISVIGVVISGLVALYMAYAGYGVWALVVQSLLNSAIGALLLWLLVRWHPSWEFSASSFRSLFSFGSKLLASSLLHTVYTNLYTLVIGKAFNASQLGLYSKASNISKLPSLNITNILNRVLYPVLCEVQDDNSRVTDKFYLYIRLSSLIVFPLMVGLAVVAEPAVLLVLSEKWLPCVPYLQILSIAYMWDPVMNLTCSVLNVKHRSDLMLRAEIVKKVVAIVILVVTIPFGVEIMCYGLLCYSFIDLFIITQYTKRILPEITFFNHVKKILPILLQSLFMGVIVWIWMLMFDNLFVQLFGGVFVGGVVYLTSIFVFCKSETKLFLELFAKR